MFIEKVGMIVMEMKRVKAEVMVLLIFLYHGKVGRGQIDDLLFLGRLAFTIGIEWK